ncbi:hypothetical protein BGZ49_000595 [Haplosporangium sp. Z 27]|nr:hypothetical protein BGZ49_000595 [Haplosporangium sp. Z 27]
MRCSIIAFIGTVLIPSLATAITASAAAVPEAAKVINVDMIDIKFVPADITVNVGDQVVWTNSDHVLHNVMQGSSCKANGGFSSGLITYGEVYSHTFDSAGEYPYFCSIHCKQGMVGMITVN